jgi:hypothetical protein
MSTSHNARVIEEELGEACQHISEAIEKFKNAIAAIESAENKPALKTPDLETLKGLLEVGFRDTVRVTREWRNFADSRAYSESQSLR